MDDNGWLFCLVAGPIFLGICIWLYFINRCARLQQILHQLSRREREITRMSPLDVDPHLFKAADSAAESDDNFVGVEPQTDQPSVSATKAPVIRFSSGNAGDEVSIYCGSSSPLFPVPSFTSLLMEVPDEEENMINNGSGADCGAGSGVDEGRISG